MSAKLPGKEEFGTEVIKHLVPKLDPDQLLIVTNLFNHAFDHPWVDDEIRSSIAVNLCREYGIEIPEKYQE